MKKVLIAIALASTMVIACTNSEASDQAYTLIITTPSTGGIEAIDMPSKDACIKLALDTAKAFSRSMFVASLNGKPIPPLIQVDCAKK